jgi:hypothetical protein
MRHRAMSGQLPWLRRFIELRRGRPDKVGTCTQSNGKPQPNGKERLGSRYSGAFIGEV